MPDIPLIQEILHSGKLAYGTYGKKFESSLSSYLNNDRLITTNTYSSAILVVMSTLNIKPGDSVITSPMTCLASSQPLLSMGINIIWSDINPKTGTLCPESVKKNITKNCKAIIHNHFCGHVGFIDEINAIGKQYEIPIIDDCIEAFGSEYKGNKLGNVGTDITIFSFNAVRLPNTISGGAIVFNDVEFYKKSLLVRDSGIDRTRFRDDIGEINPKCDIEIVGQSATMGEDSSYIGFKQMEKIDSLIKKQRHNAAFWNLKLMDDHDLKPIRNENANPNFWVYGVLAKNKRQTILKYRDLNYYASGVHVNINNYSVFKNEKYHIPGVIEFDNNFVALPSGWWFNNKI